MTFELARLGPDDWAEFRAIRLRALAEAPSAFGSTLAGEQPLGEKTWRARLAGRTQFIARQQGAAIGTAGAFREDDAIWLISMWVEPRARRLGVAAALVAAVVDRARELGCATVRLRFTRGNLAAERLYLRCGFLRTGLEEPIPGDPLARVEIEMSLALDPDAAAPSG